VATYLHMRQYKTPGIIEDKQPTRGAKRKTSESGIDGPYTPRYRPSLDLVYFVGRCTSDYSGVVLKRR